MGENDYPTVATLSSNVHQTPPEIWRVLEAIFPVTEGQNGVRWIEFENEGDTVTFFAPRTTLAVPTVADLVAP